jgi:hypothetical protein
MEILTTQSPLNMVSRNENECFQAEQLSLFEILILSVHFYPQQRVQYHLARICKFVGGECYNNTLQTEVFTCQHTHFANPIQIHDRAIRLLLNTLPMYKVVKGPRRTC